MFRWNVFGRQTANGIFMGATVGAVVILCAGYKERAHADSPAPANVTNQPKPSIVPKPLPEMPFTSAALEYVKGHQELVKQVPRQARHLPDLQATVRVLWQGTDDLIIASYPENDPSRFDGLKLRRFTKDDAATDLGTFRLVLPPKEDVITDAIYGTQVGNDLRLWMMNRYSSKARVPQALVMAERKSARVEKTREQLAQLEGHESLLSNQLLRPFGKKIGKCSTTLGESGPIELVDAAGITRVKFNLPNATVPGAKQLRIEPDLQPLAVKDVDKFVGLLMTVQSDSVCFPERPPLNLVRFTVKEPSRDNLDAIAPATFRTFSGEGPLLEALKQSVPGTPWMAGSIEWAQLVNSTGALVFRRDTRVEQNIWCSELVYANADGQETLLDFAMILREGGPVQRISLDTSGKLLVEPYQANFWGMGKTLVPSVSPDGKKVAYLKWDQIYIADLPTTNP